MSGVQPKQLWKSIEGETFYVLNVLPDDTVDLIPVRCIEEVGLEMRVLVRDAITNIPTKTLLTTWMPTAKPSEPSPSWHEKILADDD